jgi:CBS-domain-containing membrane protein
MKFRSVSTTPARSGSAPADDGTGLTRHRVHETRRRGGVLGEFGLAVPPTITVMAVVLLIQGVAGQRLLFASLASSAFLIYYEPLHRMNSIGTMVIAQVTGCLFGIAAGATIGPGLYAGAVAMALTITALIAFDLVHPPAISTALAFAFVTTRERTVLLFVVSLVMLGVLVLLQRIAVWSMRFVQDRGWGT